ncbi:MAG: 4-(cytidine 5'-diphospho)-2-C-methyl-D-erythritol kinase [Deltaproteobacteria bacterium]|nr:4-(cytidine 5'-diphospho)-2-C-methyl-D-erythritol kinase [Candidatus Zymogenaceae bacterium]
MADSISFTSPAKVNYYLRVTGRRPDGYHDLVNVMCRVSLFDEISMTVGGAGIRVYADNPDVPSDSTNSVYRAVRLLLETAKSTVGVDIRIKKHIPVQSGLGGASSNAAAVMARLNELLGLGFTREELIGLGIRIGSDVPFFLFGSPAVATGKGEVLERVDGIADAWLVIVKPAGGISTREAYEKIDLLLTEEKKHIIIPKFIATFGDLVGSMLNDFEPVAEAMLGEITDIKIKLIKLGALKAMLSGSGSAVFGVFTNEVTARRAYEELTTHSVWNAYIAKNLFE